MSLIIALQGMLLAGLAVLPLIPIGNTHGDMLVWSSLPPHILADASGAHWGGISGPMGTYLMTGSAQALRAQGAVTLLDMNNLAVLCGARQ